MNLSEILNKLMQDNNLSNSKLSRYVNIPISTIRRIRRKYDANPTTITLKPIADFFNISIDQLLGKEKLTANKIQESSSLLNLTSSFLPIISWYEIPEFSNHPKEFLNGKVLYWISSTRHFSENAFATVVPDDYPFLFLKKDSLILIEPSKGLEKNNIALFLTDGPKKVEVYQVVLEGKDIYIQSTNPEIRGAKALPDSFKLLGSILEIRFSFEESEAIVQQEAKLMMPLI